MSSPKLNKLQVDIVARPEFWLHLNLPLVEAIQACCQRHYSGECVAAGQVGGFVYGWYNNYKWAADEGREPSPVSATWNQLDILSKCLENPPAQHAPFAYHLQRMIHVSIREARKAATTLWPSATAEVEYWSQDA